MNADIWEKSVCSLSALFVSNRLEAEGKTKMCVHFYSMVVTNL